MAKRPTYRPRPAQPAPAAPNLLVNGHSQQSMYGYQSEAHRQAWLAASAQTRNSYFGGPTAAQLAASVGGGSQPGGLGAGGTPSAPGGGGLPQGFDPGASQQIVLPSFDPSLLPQALGPADSTAIGARSNVRWLGQNEAVAPERLSPVETPKALNVNGYERPGAITTRMGWGKAYTQGSQSQGVSIVPLNLIESNVRLVCLVTYDGATNSTLDIVKFRIPSKPVRMQPPMKPSVTLTSPANASITVAIAEPAREGGYTGVLVRWSGEGFPLSPFDDVPARDADTGTGKYRSRLGVLTSWTGESAFSTAYAVPDFNGVLLYVSVWTVGLFGYSDVWRGTITVT